MLIGFSELERTGLYKARVGAKMDSWITYLLPAMKLPDFIPVGGNGHQPLEKWWLHTGVCYLCCFLSSVRKETVGFPRHFSCSLNTGELKSFGSRSLDSEHKVGGVSREQTVPISELLLLSFSAPLPVLCNSSISRISVHSVRKS